MHHRLTLLFFLIGLVRLQAQPSQILYLSGTGADQTQTWDFYCSAGRQSGRWSKIAVPSCWEQQGFGSYNYGRDKVKADEQGTYRYTFTVPADWKGQNIDIVFDGVMTDAEVRINGKLAGPKHQGAFYRFRYPIQSLLKVGGKNKLEVKVWKNSSDTSIQDAERTYADYWLFGGIFRPVWLEAYPQSHIRQVSIDAQANGQVTAYVEPKNIGQTAYLKVSLEELNGTLITSTTEQISPGEEKIPVRLTYKGCNTWSPESPYRYRLVVQLLDAQRKPVHEKRKTFGFRTIEVRPQDGIYVNGAKIQFKGVNRHSFHPQYGRTTSAAISFQDVKLMKEMNLNAVRMSHYPPDVHFLNACDSLGLFVLDELGGWQHYYSTPVARRLIKQLVERDVNHPSIIVWDNGNEGGSNPEVSFDFHQYDPQKRPVIHPWAKFNGFDNQHYREYGYGPNEHFNGEDIWFPTEFLHGLYDGGAGAGLHDWWQAMRQNPKAAGGFIWVWCDECVARKDKKDSLDCQKDQGADGVVGPYREKEGSFWAIREIWTPVKVEKPLNWDRWQGELRVQNDYLFTSLNKQSFSLNFLRFGGPAETDSLATVWKQVQGTFPDIKPGQAGEARIELPEDWRQADAIRVVVAGLDGHNAYSKTWMLKTPAEIQARQIQASALRWTYEYQDSLLILSRGSEQIRLNVHQGCLVDWKQGNVTRPLTSGPVVAHVKKVAYKSHDIRQSGDTLVVETYFHGDLRRIRWTFGPLKAVQVYVKYGLDGLYPYASIDFSLPESQMQAVKYLGSGPYRVWKNRLAGGEIRPWKKAYNNTATGASWLYPEFAGYHSDFYWAKVYTPQGNLVLSTPNKGQYLRLGTPQHGIITWNKANITPAFPSGDLGISQAIPPIGDKFKMAEHLGPQGMPNYIHSFGQNKNDFEIEFSLSWED